MRSVSSVKAARDVAGFLASLWGCRIARIFLAFYVRVLNVLSWKIAVQRLQPMCQVCSFNFGLLNAGSGRLG